jgi:hypothetical protein
MRFLPSSRGLEAACSNFHPPIGSAINRDADFPGLIPPSSGSEALTRCAFIAINSKDGR